MFNRIAFAGKFSKFFKVNIPDLNKREFVILLILVLFTVLLGVFPSPILDGLHYSISTLIYSTDIVVTSLENVVTYNTNFIVGTPIENVLTYNTNFNNIIYDEYIINPNSFLVNYTMSDTLHPTEFNFQDIL